MNSYVCSNHDCLMKYGALIVFWCRWL